MRRILVVLFALLIVFTGCKRKAVVVAKVNGEKIEITKKLHSVSKEKGQLNTIIDKLIIDALLLQKAEELGKFEADDLTQRVEKLKSSLAFNIYISDIRDATKIAEGRIEEVFNNSERFKDKKIEDVEKMIRNELIGKEVDKEISRKGSKLRTKHKIEISKEYLDFSKYSPMKSSLVVAVIDDKAKITNNELNRYFVYQKKKGDDASLSELLDDLIARKLIFIDIEDLVPEKRIQRSIETFKERQVLQYMKRQYLFEASPINPENVRKFYDDHLDEFYSKPERVDIRHILIDSQDKVDAEKEKEAKELLMRIILSAKDPQELFRVKAREYQKGPDIIKDVAGRLGPITRKVMPAAFSDAAFTLKKGEIYKKVVKTDEYGYHLLLCEDRLPAEIIPFSVEDIAEDMKRYVRDVGYRKLTEEMIADADIVILYPEYKGVHKDNEKK
ncbi:peptidyl-prolyl cis-trans isomerase [bacterium]|nr:peptidyl-prolyl cis-trans isomerase [bacterium]